MRSFAVGLLPAIVGLGLLLMAAPQAGAPPPPKHFAMPPIQPVMVPMFPPVMFAPHFHAHRHQFFLHQMQSSPNQMPYASYQMPYGQMPYGQYQMPYGQKQMPYGQYQAPYGGYDQGQSYGQSTASQDKSVVKVEVYDDRFKDATLSIPPGTTVVWTNHGHHAHTITSDKNVWPSKTLQPGEVFSYSFNQTGTFTYKCTLHPGKMFGDITVK